MKVLEVKHLKKSFGEKIILNDINFSINAGECLGVVGRSGCGKSTMARIIARLIPADGGQIFLNGVDITHTKNLKSVYKNLQMIFQLPEDSFENVDAQIKNLLVEVGLTADFAERYPHEVSGGQCQRAAIARAISISPKLLICDEATSALDAATQMQIVKLLRRLCTEKNLAILFITHDLEILKDIADNVLNL